VAAHSPRDYGTALSKQVLDEISAPL